MTTETSSSTLSERAQRSAWVSALPGLDASIAQLDHDLAVERSSFVDHALRLARPGPVPPLRLARHIGALNLARLRWAVRTLPNDISKQKWNEPGEWLKNSAAEWMRDQLAMLGPSAVEIARIISQSEGMAPGVVVEEIRRRPITIDPMPALVVRDIVKRSFGDQVCRVDPLPLTYTAITQLHGAELADGRRVMVRVRRPGVDRDLHADARVSATMVYPLEQLIPALREPHPLGFVEMATRQLLEESDLRNEALNTAELGIIIEELCLSGVEVARPIPGLATRRAVVFERLDGRPFSEARHTLDVDKTVAALVGVTIDAALEYGGFHIDMAPEHLMVLDNGNLGIVGCGSMGHFDLTTRRAALLYLTSVLSGDFENQVESMRLAGAVPEGTDTSALVADLASTEALQPATMMMGGEESMVGGLREAMTVLLRHKIRPPLEEVLFVRNVFMLRNLFASLSPDISMMMALMPLLQKLPELNARLNPPPTEET